MASGSREREAETGIEGLALRREQALKNSYNDPNSSRAL